MDTHAAVARDRDSTTMRGDAARIVTWEVVRPDGTWHRFVTARNEPVG